MADVARHGARTANHRSQQPAGTGYIPDFGSAAINAKFQDALRGAYTSRAGFNYPYHPLDNNCAMAFNVAFNAIRKGIKFGRVGASVIILRRL
jgi:hypothetical protein